MVGITYEEVKPHLVVKPHQVADAIAFYERAFGAEVVKKQTVKKQHPTGADKSVDHAHLRFGQADILLVEETEELGSRYSILTCIFQELADGRWSQILHRCCGLIRH